MLQLPAQEPAGDVHHASDALSGSVEELAYEVAGLRAALATRDVIGQAKGIIRLLTRSDADTAFNVLCQLSQDTNRKVKEVAAVLVECSAAGQPMPHDLSASWRQRTDPLSLNEQA